MSDNEIKERRERDVDSDSSEDEGPRDLAEDRDEGIEDSSPEDNVEDSIATSSSSSGPKVHAAVAKDDTDDSEGENDDEDEIKQKNLPREHEKEEMKQAESSESEDEKEDEKEEDEDEEDDDEEVAEEVAKVDAERRSASPVRSPSPEAPAIRSPSPAPEDRSRSASPAPEDRSRSASPERKSSHGSSSYDERASSMSPEPAQPISTPHTKVVSPSSSQTKDITKIYTEALHPDSSNGFNPEKIGRSKPVGDITQIYTASLHKENQSPKLERARGGKPVKDITQLYTAAFLNKSEPGAEISSPNRPRRNDNITKLYTGAFDGSANNFKSKPNDEITNPKKHNMATSLDRDAIRDAYTQVMEDNNGVEWAAFKFDSENMLSVSGTGSEFSEFKSQFGSDDRGFGYIKIQTGDEMSKRSRFLLVTWVGNNVSVMKKAKMSTDKLLVKEIIQVSRSWRDGWMDLLIDR
ncbi:suppressor protein SRP40 [Eurytemora carolleeae]|uniref:suppressor protein SRP40 n=1 Tax=Eurytemora carolleeae TaxID=1294199 RepID=UPI000C75F0E6|nr:suppressor protein SRP40 [Eurytemora carolleeae]|eukprot:XP_023339669.1 suppressor protein SRP40-like [Eurytemora affinis]